MAVTKTAIYKLPLATFEKANEVFLKECQYNSNLLSQYNAKRTKREKIKYLRFMGYLEGPKK